MFPARRPFFLTGLLLALPVSAAEVPELFEAQGLIAIQAETLVLGRRGTRALGRDTAVLAPGRTAVLELEVPLARLPGAGEGESVSLRLEVTYTSTQLPAEEDGRAARAGVRLDIDSTAQARRSGAIVMRSGGSELARPGSIFHEAFVSSETEERVVVNLHAAPWRPEPEPLVVRMESAPRPVHYRVAIYRRDTEGLEFLGTPQLHSLIGRTASYSFGFVLEGPPGARPTGEDLRLEVRGVELRDESLSGVVSLTGTLRETSVEASAAWSLRSGEEARLTLELGEVAGKPLGAILVLVASF